MIITIGTIVRISENNGEEAGQVGIIRGYNEKTDEYLIKPGRYGAECIRVRSMNIRPVAKKASPAGDPLDSTPKYYCSEADLLRILDFGSGGEKVISAKKEAVNRPKGADSKAWTHENICKELTALYTRKNADYGDSFHKSYIEEGMAMPRIRLGDKFNRFCSLTRSDNQRVKDESIRDTLIDLANYAIMTIMEMDGEKK